MTPVTVCFDSDNKLRLLNKLYVYVCLYFDYNEICRFGDVDEILESNLIRIIVFFFCKFIWVGVLRRRLRPFDNANGLLPRLDKAY